MGCAPSKNFKPENHLQDTKTTDAILNNRDSKTINQVQEDKNVTIDENNFKVFELTNHNLRDEVETTNQVKDKKEKMDSTTGTMEQDNVSVQEDEEKQGTLSQSDSEEKTQEDKKVELTEEEIEAKKEKKLNELKKIWEIFTDGTELKDLEGKYTKHFRVIIHKTSSSHFALKELPIRARNQYKREFYTLLVQSGGIEKLCDVVINILGQGFMGEEGKVDLDMYKPLINSLGILQNFTDNAINRTDLVMNHPGCMEAMATTLREKKDGHLSQERKNCLQEESVLKVLLGIVHNIAIHEEHIARLRQLGYVPVLVPYMNSAKDTFKICSLAALADIVDEKESELLSTDQGILNFLIKSLKQAIKSRRRQYGWSTEELARTVRRVARNDTNKRLLVELGVLPALVDLSGFDKEAYQEEAVGALWSLSFDKENQNDMILDNESFPIDTLIKLRNSPHKEVRKICGGALWTMREKLAESEKYKDIGNQYLKLGSDSSPEKHGHIMISYQWSSQEMMKTIRDSLRASGLRVWMDIDDMKGSTLDAMASAVEHADIVLVCFSQKYKDSDNCRAEAEYAFQKKKKIIPLKMERDYQPDGWLGFIIGAKLFFDFSGKYPFESKMDGLLKELHTKLGVAKAETTIAPMKAAVVESEKPKTQQVPLSVPSASHVTVIQRIVPSVQATEVVEKWTQQEVSTWLTKHNVPTGRLKTLTGPEVAFLQIVMIESPDFFYKTITETLQITDLLTLSRLRLALNDTTL